MAKGYILLHRQIWDNRIWKRSEPFDGRSAWIDLLLMANHADNESIKGVSVIKIKRGQLHTSYPKLAKRWHWSRGKVIRYLELLSGLGMISFTGTQNGTTRGTTITVIKYEVFQDWRTANGITNDTTSDTTNGTTNGITSGTRTKNVIKNDTKNERMNEGKKSYKRPAGDRSSSLKAWEELERRIEGNG